MDLLKRIWKEEEGQGLVEYGLIVLLVVIAAITLLNVFDIQLAAIWAEITENIGEFID